MARTKLFDFTSGTTYPEIVCNRPSATATRVNASGLIESVTADALRVDYNPVTLAVIGILIEGSSTNNLRNSNDFSSVWVNSGVVTPANAVSPDGTTNATKFEGGVTYQDVTKDAAAVTYTTSVYFKLGSGSLTLRLTDGGATNLANVIINLSTALISTAASVSGNFTNASARVEHKGGDYYRAILTCTSNTATTIRTRYAFTGTGNFTWLYGAQTESGSEATSYIPTTSAAVTRNADVATITGTAFSGFWRSGPGSILVRALPSTVSGTRPLVQVDDATADNIIALRGNTTNPELYIRAGGSDQATIDAGTISAAAYRLAGAWQAGSAAASLNSGLAVNGAPASIPAVTQMRLGSDGTNYLNGHLQAVEYYDARLTNANLQVASSATGSRSIIQSVLRSTVLS